MLYTYYSCACHRQNASLLGWRDIFKAIELVVEANLQKDLRHSHLFFVTL